MFWVLWGGSCQVWPGVWLRSTKGTSFLSSLLKALQGRFV